MPKFAAVSQLSCFLAVLMVAGRSQKNGGSAFGFLQDQG